MSEIKPHVFDDKSSLAERELAMIPGQVSDHIHPEIVDLIVRVNEKFEKEFSEHSPSLFDTNDYFYKGSDCLFPGVRRPINKEKEGRIRWKNNINEGDGTIFNDNTYPRHIWTFLSMNKGYSGPNWKKSGLNAFELAHVFGHKVDEKELEKEVFKHDNNLKLTHYLHLHQM